jgi:hypothetical protein
VLELRQRFTFQAFPQVCPHDIVGKDGRRSLDSFKKTAHVLVRYLALVYVNSVLVEILSAGVEITYIF